MLKSEGFPYAFLRLASIKHEKKLPVVLSKEEVWAMLQNAKLLKHRILIGLLYGCGLRCMEAINVRLQDLDFDRKQLLVYQGKGKKDRYFPLSVHLIPGVKIYKQAEKPQDYLFNGQPFANGAGGGTSTWLSTGFDSRYSQRGVHWAVKQTAKRVSELMPVPYFHVVFTLPESIHSLAIYQPKMVYDILFEATWETLQRFGKAKEIQMGMITVLHTWGQQLSLHPHLHCIVPGGGVDKIGQWKNSRTDGKFLFPVKVLSKVFRAKYCEKLKAKNPIGYEQIRQELWQKPWVVFAKRPFGNAKSVV